MSKRKRHIADHEMSHPLGQLQSFQSLDTALGAEEVMQEAKELFIQMKEIGDRLSNAYEDLLHLQAK